MSVGLRIVGDAILLANGDFVLGSVSKCNETQFKFDPLGDCVPGTRNVTLDGAMEAALAYGVQRIYGRP